MCTTWPTMLFLMVSTFLALTMRWAVVLDYLQLIGELINKLINILFQLIDVARAHHIGPPLVQSREVRPFTHTRAASLDNPPQHGDTTPMVNIFRKYLPFWLENISVSTTTSSVLTETNDTSTSAMTGPAPHGSSAVTCYRFGSVGNNNNNNNNYILNSQWYNKTKQ